MSNKQESAYLQLFEVEEKFFQEERYLGRDDTLF
jgi:hypothetical protein